MTSQQEGALRILLVYYLFAVPIAAAVGVLIAKLIEHRGRSWSLWLGTVSLTFVLGFCWLGGFAFLAENCGGGGGCEGRPQWPDGGAMLATGPPVLGLIVLTAGLKALRSRSEN